MANTNNLRNYNGNRFRTITVSELIELLEGVDDKDALVVFSTDYGDYHRTPQALGLRGEVEETKIAKSAYSNSGFQIVEDDEDDYDEEPDGDEVEGPTFLLIK